LPAGVCWAGRSLHGADPDWARLPADPGRRGRVLFRLFVLTYGGIRPDLARRRGPTTASTTVGAGDG
jgi:hypothetical protein